MGHSAPAKRAREPEERAGTKTPRRHHPPPRPNGSGPPRVSVTFALVAVERRCLDHDLVAIARRHGRASESRILQIRIRHLRRVVVVGPDRAQRRRRIRRQLRGTVLGVQLQPRVPELGAAARVNGVESGGPSGPLPSARQSVDREARARSRSLRAARLPAPARSRPARGLARSRQWR